MARAARVAESVLKRFHPQIESVQLIPSTGGIFEVKADGQLIFSKKALGRFPEEGEIEKLFEG